ncbi:vWA domain-containing protein [Actinokineospora sp. HUAS TT18]|uniref:vWA domain-containing protein n=1 Tax=Actinokineospora sp. HUAS TT18 TaxID=3447451 RepID=UPI003F527008
MTTHLAADPTATATAVFPARPEWLTLSAALADEVPVIADREDLLVTIAPGAGGGAPACFYPTRALIEVDGVHLGVDPGTVDPADMSDRARYAITWGLLTHECGHAKHTAWDPPPGTPAAVAEAAMLLEEPRMETAHIRRRPDDRHWLRASARGIILADLNPAGDPAHAPQMTAPAAARAAALLLARADGGILTRAEVAPVAHAVDIVLGTDTMNKLRAIWRAALRTADTDTDTMIELGRQWCEIVGAEPNTPAPAGTPAPTGTPPPTGDGSPSGSSGATPPPVPPSVLAAAIDAALDRIAANVAQETPPEDPAARAAAARAAMSAAANDAANAARSVFTGSGGARRGQTTTAGTRPPTDDERTAARVLARALNTAGVRDRVPVKTTSTVPPGRLRMRGALAADAQRAAGALPTAEPFTRTTRTPIPSPPLRLAIACDVSGSMKSARAHVASAAWILADAARHTTVPTQTATVIFGHGVRPITRPGTTPTAVTEFNANDNWEDIPTALDALDGALGLSSPGAARLLVIVSDGQFRDQPRRDGQRKLDRLRASGCAVLWLTIGEHDTPLDGATLHHLNDPATAAQAIGRAATAALRAATR